jgi:hypothetical protein
MRPVEKKVPFADLPFHPVVSCLSWAEMLRSNSSMLSSEEGQLA